jgi:hypothetical protein
MHTSATEEQNRAVAERGMVWQDAGGGTGEEGKKMQ